MPQWTSLLHVHRLMQQRAASWPVMLLWFQLNPSVSSFQRRFVSEIKRCEEMERILGKREHLGWARVGVAWAHTWTIYIFRVVSDSRLSVFCKKWSLGDLDAPVVITMKQTISIFLGTGYLLREIQKARIAVPEEDESPLAPPPRQVLEIMVSVISTTFYYKSTHFVHFS